MADKCLNLVWLKVPNTAAFTKLADQIMSSPNYASPAVKVETASSGIASFLEAYRDIFWGMRYPSARPFSLRCRSSPATPSALTSASDGWSLP
jgi:hypothetical protein